MVATVNIGEVGSYISGKEKFLLLEENFFRRAQFICWAENCRTFVTLKNRARTLEYIEIFLSSSSQPGKCAPPIDNRYILLIRPIVSP